MQSEDGDVDFRARLARALGRRQRGPVSVDALVVPTLGGSNRTVLFDAVEDGHRRRMVSRQTTYAGENSPFLPAAEQFRLMRLAWENGFPVPEPILLFEPDDGLGEGFVTAFVDGETMPSRLIAGEALANVRPRLASDAGRLLALLHGIEPPRDGLVAETPDSLDALSAQRARYDLYDEPHPAIELGLRWLEMNRPPPSPPVLLHGDFRNGNLMVGDDGIRAVLDWECAHLGSPAEDIGWLCMRSWRFARPDRPVGGFGMLADLLEAYERAGGRAVGADEVRYWQIFGLVRWGVLNMMQAHGHVFDARSSVVFAACGRNTSMIEYDLLMTLRDRLQ